MAQPQEGRRPRARLGGFAQELAEAALVAFVLATFTRTFVVQAFKIPSPSMEDNLLVGDHIVVNKFVYGPRLYRLESLLLPGRPLARGDVVVFKFPEDPGRDFVKRCVGLPGDRLEIRDKQLLLDGEPVDEAAYVHHKDARVFRSPLLDEAFRRRDNLGPLRVPDGHYFFLGDNRDNSHDSRFWGPVPEGHVKGRALAIYWSLAPEPAAGAGGDPGTGPGEAGRPPGLAGRLARLPAATRWERIFTLVR